MALDKLATIGPSDVKLLDEEAKKATEINKKRNERVSLFFSKTQLPFAQMVELVDTLVSGTSGRKAVGVRVPLWVRFFPLYLLRRW